LVNCKRCLLEEASVKAFSSIKEAIEKIPEKEKTDEIIYRARLSICLSCEKLDRGTCLSCGCYVELRAARKALSCPRRRW